jgi:hypothetical protein
MMNPKKNESLLKPLFNSAPVWMKTFKTALLLKSLSETYKRKRWNRTQSLFHYLILKSSKSIPPVSQTSKYLVMKSRAFKRKRTMKNLLKALQRDQFPP